MATRHVAGARHEDRRRGWFVKLRLSEPDELADLLDEDAYQTHVNTL